MRPAATSARLPPTIAALAPATRSSWAAPPAPLGTRPTRTEPAPYRQANAVKAKAPCFGREVATTIAAVITNAIPCTRNAAFIHHDRGDVGRPRSLTTSFR